MPLGLQSLLCILFLPALKCFSSSVIKVLCYSPFTENLEMMGQNHITGQDRTGDNFKLTIRYYKIMWPPQTNLSCRKILLFQLCPVISPATTCHILVGISTSLPPLAPPLRTSSPSQNTLDGSLFPGWPACALLFLLQARGSPSCFLS